MSRSPGVILMHLIQLHSLLLLSFLAFPNFVRMPGLNGVNEGGSGLAGDRLDLCQSLLTGRTPVESSAVHTPK
jgi:hypothetical protein